MSRSTAGAISRTSSDGGFGFARIETGSIPPTIHHETPDPECEVDVVPNEARRHHVDVALNNAFAFGGNNSCLVLTAPRI